MRNHDVPEETQRFARWCKRARRARGVTQEQLAEQAGLGMATVSYLESGRRDPCISTVIRIAEALHYRMVFVSQEDYDRLHRKNRAGDGDDGQRTENRAGDGPEADGQERDGRTEGDG